MKVTAGKGKSARRSNPEVVYFIMAGGEGMRLWPLSRSHFPKQLHALFGEGSFLQQTVRRILPVSRPDHILIGTREDLYFSIQEQWQQLRLGRPPWMILEPVSRNTAPAIALAILACRERFGRDVSLVILAADHVIRQEEKFLATVRRAVAAAADNAIVTFGVVPSYPETGYGYIEAGQRINGDVFKVKKFVEKPTAERAAQYVNSRRFLWNSGMFVVNTGLMAGYLEQFAPQVWRQARLAWKARTQKTDSARFGKKTFARFPKISIDYAVMEKAPQRRVIKADFGWCDVGCWRMVYELSPKDKQGNVFSGDVCGLDTHGTFVRAEKRVVGTVGLRDLIVIDTPDALLISDRNRSQDVKAIVERLNERGSSLTQFHATVYRPWGNYTVLEEGPGYKIKRVVVKPGAQLSLQKHAFRSEHWVVISGKARIVQGENLLLLNANESVFIPRGKRHRIMNPFKRELSIIEVQTGTRISEADIERFEDTYERV